MVRHRYSWEEETLIIDLYTRLSYSEINDKSPEIIRLCSMLNTYGYDCVVSGLRNKMENLKSVDQEYISDGRIGRGHVAIEFSERWKNYQDSGFIGLDGDIEKAIQIVKKHNPDIPHSGISGRTGQTAFRERVLTSFDRQCCISGMNTAELLQACHIKPYRVCMAEGRMEQTADVRNGLCMNVLYHKAFDSGLFSIDEDRRVMLSPKLELKADDKFFRPYEGKKIYQTNRTIIGDTYLEYHRKNIFVC